MFVPRCVCVCVCVCVFMPAEEARNPWVPLGPGLTFQVPECMKGTLYGWCVGGQLQGVCVRGGHKGKEARPGTWKLDLGAGNGAELRQLPLGECKDVWWGRHHCRTTLPRLRSLEWCPGPAQVTFILSVLWRPVPGGPEGDQDQGQCLG